MTQKSYWDTLYAENMDACIGRIHDTSRDFLAELKKNTTWFNEFVGAKSIIEFGCGTGDMCEFERGLAPRRKYLGVDISDVSIEAANKAHKDEFTEFICGDIMDIQDRFDISYSSNTLEHFKNPYVIIDKLLDISKYLFITVPYNQQDLEGYDGEGGAGHVFTFTENSFDEYNLVYYSTYFTHTWAHGLQLLAVLAR